MVKKHFTTITKLGDSHYARIPAKLIREKTFPFKVNEEVMMELKSKKLEVRKLNEND